LSKIIITTTNLSPKNRTEFFKSYFYGLEIFFLKTDSKSVYCWWKSMVTHWFFTTL